MDCKKFQKFVTPLVDDQIDKEKRKDAQYHLSKCLSCFYDYKIESLIKTIVQTKYIKSCVPNLLESKIFHSLKM